MGRIRRSIARCPYIPDHIASVHAQAFFNALGISIEVRVVITENALPVELIDRQAARFAEKKFLDHAVIDGVNWRAARRKNIGSLMRPAASG